MRFRINRLQIRENFVQGILRRFCDIKYQKNAWVNHNSHIYDTFEEAFCTFFDDYDGMFTEIKKGRWPEYGLTQKQANLLISFYDALDNYEEPKFAKDLLTDPKWLEIVEFAKKVYRELKAP